MLKEIVYIHNDVNDSNFFLYSWNVSFFISFEFAGEIGITFQFDREKRAKGEINQNVAHRKERDKRDNKLIDKCK